VNTDEHTHMHTDISSRQAFVLWHSMKVTLQGDKIITASKSDSKSQSGL